MRKIGKLYIVTESEMDEIRYDLDLFYKYKVMAELNWREQEHEESNQADL